MSNLIIGPMAAINAALGQVIVRVLQAFIAVILAVITFLYYKETKKHTKEMKRSRRPVIKASVFERENGFLAFRIVNTGEGAAHNIIAKWGFKNIDKLNVWEPDLLLPNEENWFWLPFDSKATKPRDIRSELGENEGEIKFEVSYEDPHGEEFETTEELSVYAGNRPYRIYPRETELEGIQGKLGDIEDEVSNVSGSIAVSTTFPKHI